MTFTDPNLRALAIRETTVSLSADRFQAWDLALAGSGRFKLSLKEALARVCLAFDLRDTASEARVVASALKSVPEISAKAGHAARVAAAYQVGLLLSPETKSTTAIEVRDVAALGARVLSRERTAVFGPLAEQADRWLAERGAAVRGGLQNERQVHAPWSVDVPGRLDSADPEHLRTRLNSLRDAVQRVNDEVPTAIGTISDSLGSQIDGRLAVLAEQQSVMWWLIGRSDPAANLASWAHQRARELAAITVQFPPPSSARELFRRKSAELETEMLTDLADAQAGDEGLGGVWAPVHTALRSAAGGTGQRSPAALAFALYDEILLSRALRR